MFTLITGASGFVGTNLTEYFKSAGVDNKHLSRQGLNSVSIDDFTDVDVIVHLAGKAHDLKKVSVPEEYYQINFEITKKLYDLFLKSEAKKFIFISSVKAAADSVLDELTEDVKPNPKTEYGKSKLMAEQYILSQPLPVGKSCYILRPCMIHGPGNKGNLNLLYNFVKKGIPYPLAGFNNKRSFLSVQNLCFVIVELVKGNDIASGTYQVADDDPLSTNDLIRLLASSLNRKPRLLKIPVWIIKLSAGVGHLFNLPLNNERLNKLTENYVVSNKKIKDALKKQFPITSTEGLKITALSFNED